MKSESYSARTFFALLPDPGAQEAIRQIQAQLSPERGRLVKTANIHLTLLFLGQVGRARLESLSLDCAGIESAAFELQISHSGWWKNPAIFWLGPACTPDALTELVRQLKSIAARKGIICENRPFIPHVTLMRSATTAPTQPWFQPFSWHASSFSLLESVQVGGYVQYRELGNWQLS